jgi:hypothetical protein
MNNSNAGNGFFTSATSSTVVDRFAPNYNRNMDRSIDPMKESTINYVKQFSRPLNMENLPEDRLRQIS